jgi:geranylgeranyl reductase family protein
MGPAVIVGGGPAGAACAFGLARGGVPCVVFDRAVFPREKVCGGALSLRGSSLLVASGMLTEAELNDLTVASHTGLSLWDGDRCLRTWSGHGPAIRLVDRMAFDAFLLGKAAAAGAEVHQSISVLSVDAMHGSITLSTGERLQYGMLVGADGAGSMVRRKIFPMRKGRGTGIGLEVFVPRAQIGSMPHELQIRFGRLPYGYGWVFPGPETVCIGAGVTGSRAGGAQVRAALEELLRELGLDPGSFRLRGAPIPSLALHRELGAENIFLVGDAAGLCDQVSGEGICHAVSSGLLVAEAIGKGWSRKRLCAEARKGCMGVVLQSMRFRHLLYSPMLREEAMYRLRQSPLFAEAYWSLISGETDYLGMLGRILRGI